MATHGDLHAVGIRYQGGKDKGYVVVAFRVVGGKVVDEELISPDGAEASVFAAGRLIASAKRALLAAQEDAESC